MDNEQLIESGRLEMYLLGIASKAEEKQLEPYLDLPEIKEKLREVELQLERIGMANAVTPPEHLQEQILGSLSPNHSINEESSSKIANLDYHRLQSQIKRWRSYFTLAASLAGLLALGLAWQFFNNNRVGQMNERMANMEQKIEQLSSSNAIISDQLAYINHTYTTPIVLKGTRVSPESKAVVYWNPKVDEALLSTNGLPKLSNNQVYQIWADVDGKMVSMKVFTTDEKLVKLPYMPEAESLNITVEPKGGSDHPTVSQLYVNATTKES